MLLRRRLEEEGPEAIHAYIQIRPKFLQRPDFISMLRCVLNDDFVTIAFIYSGNLRQTSFLLDSIQEMICDDVKFITILFELVRINDNFNFEQKLFQILSGLTTENLTKALASHDFLKLSKKSLIVLGYMAVAHDHFLLVTKVVEANPGILKEFNLLLSQDSHIYTQVKSAEMLEHLFKLREYQWNHS